MSETVQMSLVDAEAARDEAIANVARPDDTKVWLPHALAAIRHVAELRDVFTTDGVWFILDRWDIEPPREPRAMGAAMRQAVAAGLCVPTDRTKKSVRVDCHARPLRVWRSLL